MTGTITYILSRAGFRAMNGPLADERRRLAGAEPPAAYVSYDPRLLAGAGWYGYRIALKGGDRQMVERARYMLSERYTVRDGYEYYADGVYVFGVLLRERVPHYGISGGAPTPEPDALNFYMPNGGTISLNKTGSPTVVELEYSIDGGSTWTVWAEDQDGNRSLTLTAGQRMYVRNTSETNTTFNISNSDYYNFNYTDTAYAYGIVESLLCKSIENAVLSNYCYCRLFAETRNLLSAPTLSSINTQRFCYYVMFLRSGIKIPPVMMARNASNSCCRAMFESCNSLTESPIIRFNYIKNADDALKWMFVNANSLKKVTILSTELSSPYCLYNWLNGVSVTGDFYCPAELTIPTGASGIPTGWTRHDI